jgi:hypothetical protein
MSAEQARQYVVCREEGESGGALYLIEDVRVEVGKGRPPGPEKSAFADLDHDSVVYPISGSFTAYQCEKTNPGIPTREFYNLNANCRVHQEPNASGICYRDTFGDWTCKMEDMAQRLQGPNLRAGSGVPPPQGP